MIREWQALGAFLRYPLCCMPTIPLKQYNASIFAQKSQMINKQDEGVRRVNTPKVNKEYYHTRFPASGKSNAGQRNWEAKRRLGNSVSASKQQLRTAPATCNSMNVNTVELQTKHMPFHVELCKLDRANLLCNRCMPHFLFRSESWTLYPDSWKLG